MADLSRLTNLLKILFYIGMLIAIITLISSWMQINLLNKGNVTEAKAELNDVREGIIGFIYALYFIFTSIIFCR